MDRVAAAAEFTNVTGGYRKRPVLENLSFKIGQGEIIGVIGPNGAGKTSLLRAMTGLLRITSGAVRLFGEDVSRLPAGRRAGLVGVVSQDVGTPMAYTVGEIVSMGRTSSLGMFSFGRFGVEDRRIVERAMIYTDVADMRNRLFSELSGGERQRAVIAMALAQQPRMILLDEATSHLDMNHCLEVMQIVERLNREEGVTVVMVSHDLNLSGEFCRRLLLMDRGKVVADGKPSEVYGEEILRRVYRCDVRVQKNQATGSIVVTPARRLASGRSGRGVRVHVIGGGGCAGECLRLLCLCDYTVTCGVLNEFDSDAEVAAALGLETVREKPFCHVGVPALERAIELSAGADAVVVCGAPFGPGNAANLRIAGAALDRNGKAFIMDGIAGRDFTRNGEATSAVAELVGRGARLWNDLSELLDMLPSRESEAGGGRGPEMER